MKTALDLQPMPWTFFAAVAAALCYGLWPVLRAEHFRQTCLRYTPPWLRPFAAPTEVIRVGGILWVLMCAFALVLGIASRV